MPELLLQSAIAASQSKQLAARASQIKADCHAQHGDTASLVSCPSCYEALLDALKARFLGSSAGAGAAAAGTPEDQQQPTQEAQQQQQPPQQPQEWFTSRRPFLSELEPLVDSAKEYQISPQEIDDRVREERCRWYAERVRGSLLRLMVEDASTRSAVFEKLEDSSTTAAEGDPVKLAREVAEILSTGPLAAGKGAETDLLQRLAAAAVSGPADDQTAKFDVLKELFFKSEDGNVSEDDQKYLDMLLNRGLSMEQVVDKILEERQTAVGAREQTSKLKQRLEELRRARAAHEAHKSRKAQRRESLAQQKVPEELYTLPSCSVCKEAPSTQDFFCCTICTILAGNGVQEKQTVFCSKKCEEKGYTSHAETHICSSAWDCIQVQKQPQPHHPPGGVGVGVGDQDTPMDDAPPPPNDLCFCTECLTSSLKHPTKWCSRACAEANFQAHRDEVHLPERKKLGLVVDDEATLEYLLPGSSNNSDSGQRKYRAKDIKAVTTSLEEAVKEWEGRNRVQLQGAV